MALIGKFFQHCRSESNTGETHPRVMWNFITEHFIVLKGCAPSVTELFSRRILLKFNWKKPQDCLGWRTEHQNWNSENFIVNFFIFSEIDIGSGRVSLCYFVSPRFRPLRDFIQNWNIFWFERNSGRNLHGALSDFHRICFCCWIWKFFLEIWCLRIHDASNAIRAELRRLHSQVMHISCNCWAK